MSGDADLLVLGGGPAGIAAALAADEHNLKTVILDEAAAAGGQIYRALPPGFRLRDGDRQGSDFAIGNRLRKRIAESGVVEAFGRRVWSVAEGFKVETVGPGGAEQWTARAVIVATGARERVIPFPGWTTPGVLGLAAATILLKSQQVVPAGNVVIAGSGPLLMAVAAGIIEKGGTVGAVVDLNGPKDWLAAAPAMASRPRLLAKGLRWTARVRASGVPLLFRHTVTAVVGDDRVRRVVAQPVDSSWRPKPNAPTKTFDADTLTVGHGLVPETQVTHLLRARHEYGADRGGWVAVHDSDYRTTVENLYVAGDCAGIAGAEPASLRGRIAGLAAARDSGRISEETFARATADLRRKLKRAEHFGAAAARLMALRRGLIDTVKADTVVCRCEDVTRAEIENAASSVDADVNQVKSWTRCGMGPCQGRMCGETAALLMPGGSSDDPAPGPWTARAPIGPVGLNAFAGDLTQSR